MNVDKAFLDYDAEDNNGRTPIQGSGSYPVFREAGLELACKLDKINTVKCPEATLFAEELRWYADEFGKWSARNRPSEEDRSRLIREFLTACTKVMEFLAAQNKKRLESKTLPPPRASGLYRKER